MESPLIGPFLIVLCSFLWASDTLFRLPLLAHADALTIVLIEHAVATMVMLPVLFARAPRFRVLRPQDWTSIAFIGVMGSAVATLCLTASYHYINPSVAILLQKLQPLVSITGARVFLGERPRGRVYVWGLAALAGAMLLSAPELAQAEFGFKARGLLLALVAIVSWGLSTVFGRYASQRNDFAVLAFLRFVFGFAALGVYAAASGNIPKASAALFHAGASTLSSLAYIALVSGVFAMNLYYAGLRRTPATVASIAELSFPLAAVILNWVFLDQRLTALQLAGGCLLVFSVFAVAGNKPKGE
ncbi:MAG: DMT family transporter [Deltaproteobacteria bacterium]|nr:DMT family transporter [Deltaproteobacteria bacterium]